MLPKKIPNTPAILIVKPQEVGVELLQFREHSIII